MGRKKPTPVDENPPAQGGGGKSKKKNRAIDDDEYMIGSEVSEDQSQKNQEEEVAVASMAAGKKKKGKKGGSKGGQSRDENEEAKDGDEDGDDGVPPVVFTGKKKSKSKKSGSTSLFSASSFDILDEEDNEKEKDSDVENEKDDTDEPVQSFSGKKKPSKSKKSNGLFTATSFDAIVDEGEVVDVGDMDSKTAGEDDDDAPVIKFSGKKKSSKSSKKNSNLFGAALLDEVDDLDANDSVSASNDGDQEDEDVPTITFSGKKKSSKSKQNRPTPAFGDDVSIEVDQPFAGSSNETEGKSIKDSKVNQVREEVVETSKNKKKKKKSGRTAQEEDDLDKILAELGEAPPVAQATAPPPQVDNAQVQAEPAASTEVKDDKKEAEIETGESAAAKKKKKKKEKEKEKKAAAAASSSTVEVEVKEEKQDIKSKVADKKLPKHVREMQEALARRKEAEERFKREEEERLRKEEEERKRQEELERLAEEAKRRKKEKEKEKYLKKKQEGKILTQKQREEARRLEIMRNQFLANAMVPTTETSASTSKRPIYGGKSKGKRGPKANDSATVNSEDSMEANQNQQDVIAEVEAVEVAKAEETEAALSDVEQKAEVEHAAEENGVEDDDDEEWDAKSWDDATLNLGIKSAFDEEEVDEEAEPGNVPVAKKEAKHINPPASENAKATREEAKPSIATKNVVNPEPVSGHDLDNEEQHKDIDVTDKNRKKDSVAKREARTAVAHAKRSADDLRSPICCIMGHVDTGKTKLLDCIRRTNVQEGEAGGITQQIGATYFPAENIRERTKELKADATLRVPGLLVIDTPGHESFTNLRSRGSGLCDIAILVVDIMHGLEPQTIESLNLLKMRNTEFIIALNKVDRLYGWKTCPNSPIVKAMKQQTNDVQNEFRMRLTQIVTQFKEQGMNTELYYKNKEMGETSSIVPTSAISGEGIPDLLLLLVQWTQKTMVEKLMFSDEVQCTVLEVKVIEGLGTTIDVVLVNGVLREGDQVVVCGMQGPIVTTIRALLTPHPMKELRIKGSYLHHKEIKAAQGIKITAQGLEHAIPGTALYVVGPEDDVDDAKEAAMQDMNSVLSRIDKSGEGVCVQASTLGSLEALLEFLKSPAVNIPVSGISIGPVHKKDVMKASVMLERKKEYATILAFDVKGSILSSISPQMNPWILLPSSLGFLIFLKSIFSLLKCIHNILLRPPKNLKAYGSWAVITGATDGIGKSLAFELAKNDLNLILVGRNSNKLKNVSNEILLIHPNVCIKAVVVDFSCDLGEGIRAIEEAVEGVDVGVLVNNVGVTYPKATYFHEVEEEVWRNLVRVNVEGTSRVTRAVVGGMVKRRRGAVVNMGSGASVVVPSHPLFAVYAATKAYVDQLSRCMYNEYKDFGIDVQCQVPLYVATNMASKVAFIKRASFFVPSPDTYARSSIRWIGYESRCTPYWAHSFQWYLASLLPETLLDKWRMSIGTKRMKVL